MVCSMHTHTHSHSHMHTPLGTVSVPDPYDCLYKFRDRRKGALSVDDEDAVTGVSTDGATQLDTDGRIWIGTVSVFFLPNTDFCNNH